MFKILRQSLRAGVKTQSYPESSSTPPAAFRGRPVIDFARCTACGRCADACPTDAITLRKADENESILSLSIGSCIFCGACADACPDSIEMTKEHQLATGEKDSLTTCAFYRKRDDGTMELLRIEGKTEDAADGNVVELGARLKARVHEVLGRSLHIREVDAGSCNGCEIEITALNNAYYDIERFGIHFVASPRHADMLLVTGPVTRNMEIALKETYEATPEPRLVVAVGACAISGGVFGRTYASLGGVDTVIPVDVYIPGCPPRPEALLHGILLALGRRG